MKPLQTLPTIEALREMFRYEPESGELYWRVPATNRRMDRPAGCLHPSGYQRVSIGSRDFLVHRIIFAMAHNRWPTHFVDHIDRNSTNNRVKNLREANRAENMWNAKSRCTNTSGYKGVNWRKDRQKWHARIRVQGRNIHLGFFDNIEDANMVRRSAAEKFHGDFARHE